MSTIKISEMTQKTPAGGTERIPVSDSGTAKSLTVDVVKQYVIDAIEAIAASSAVTGADSVFILQSGALKPVDIDVVAQHAIDTIWGRDDYTPASGSDKIVIKTGSAEKTATVTNLAAYIKAMIESSILDVSGLATASSLSSGDYYLVTQGTTPKKTTLSAISTAVFTALKAYVSALAAVGTPADSDVFYVIQGGVEKKVTLSQLKAVMGSVLCSVTTTENSIPQWSSAQKTLKEGLTVQTTIRASGLSVDTAVPTEQAVRELADQLVYSQTDIGTGLEDADTIIVDDGSTGTMQRKSALLRIWTYIWSKVTGATSKTTPIGADSIAVVDSADSSAVKNVTLSNLWANLFSTSAKTIQLDDFSATSDNTDLDATTAKHGLMPKTDKIKLDAVEALADVTDAANVDAAGAVMNSDATTATMQFVVDEDDMVSNSATKVPTQQSTKAYVDTKFASAGVDIWAASAKTTAVDADKAILSDSADSGASKTITFAYLWAYILSKIQACAGKTTSLADSDIVMIQDSAASYDYKEVTLTNLWTNFFLSKVGTTWYSGATAKTTPVDADQFAIMDSAASNAIKKITLTNWWTNYAFPKVKSVKLDEMTAGTDVTTLNANTSAHGLCPKAVAPASGLLNVLAIANGESAMSNKTIFDTTAPANVGTAAAGSEVVAARRDHVHAALPFVEVDGTLSTGANTDFAPSKLVYNKTCSGSDGNDVIDLHDGTIVGQVVTIYLGTKGGTDNAVITPVTKLGYNTITLDAANEIATLQWQGATVGWIIIYTTGTVA